MQIVEVISYGDFDMGYMESVWFSSGNSIPIDRYVFENEDKIEAYKWLKLNGFKQIKTYKMDVK